MNAGRGRPQPGTVRRTAEDARRVFIDEYRFLRAAQMSHKVIAQRLGITLGTLQTRLMRYDCAILSAAEQRVADRLDALIERGEPFTFEQVCALDDGTGRWLVNTALKRGRIRSSQSRTSNPKRAAVYTPVRGGR